MLPFSSFAAPLNNAASPQLSDPAKHKRQRALEAITERLGDVPVDVSVRFNPLEVPSGDMRAWPSVTSCCCGTRRTARCR